MTWHKPTRVLILDIVKCILSQQNDFGHICHETTQISLQHCADRHESSPSVKANHKATLPTQAVSVASDHTALAQAKE